MERVITLPTEPTEGEIVKSHPLFSFINIGQRGRNPDILSAAQQMFKYWLEPL